MATEPIVTGNTVRFRTKPTLDGAIWNISTAVSSLFLWNPDGEVIEKTGMYSGGYAYYDTTTSDLNEGGMWSRAWRFVVGGLSLTSAPVQFTVVQGPE